MYVYYRVGARVRVPAVRLLLTMAVTTVLTASILLGGGVTADSAIPVVPSPPPIGPDTMAKEPYDPPGSRQPPNLELSSPSFAGKILHWGQTTYVYDVNRSDPANGKVLSQDVWEQIGEDGVPTKLHAVSTLPDGTFHQEVVETSNLSVTVWSGFETFTGSSLCETRATKASADIRAKPLFYDEAVIAELGYKQVNGSADELPMTMPHHDIEPVTRLDAGGNIQRWERSQMTATGLTEMNFIEVGDQGRVLAVGGRHTNAMGDIVAESRIAFGPLEVYAPDSVPESVFAVAHGTSEVCFG